ncbi:MAG: hypothetical protein PHQ19_08860 [Candidatus Krumholzibacteria bacterium]|nr:hypothetical protein [Candidatus Krumholzibacteria bacterium]
MRLGLVQRAGQEPIPFIFYGWSPGQAPIEASIFPNNPEMVRNMQEAMLEPMREIVGDAVDNYFLTGEHFSMPEHFTYNISPLAFIEYDEAIERLEEETDPVIVNRVVEKLRREAGDEDTE